MDGNGQGVAFVLRKKNTTFDKNNIMPRLIRVALLSLIILITDTVISIVLAGAYGLVHHSMYKEAFDAQGMAGGALFLALMRLAFYYIIFVFTFYWLHKKLKLANNLLRLVVFNCSIYILISLLFGLVFMPETKYIFTSPLFIIIIVSTLLSPILLTRITAFKNLLNATDVE